MADGLQVLSAVEQGVPVVAIAATFQKNPTVLIAQPGTAKIEQLKGKPIAIASAANTTYWPWLRQQFGFSDQQKRPYGFSVQPFLADKSLSQQGFATSEPFSIEKAGVKPVVFLLADYGYPPYSEALVVRRDTLDKRRDALARFVLASAEGWKSYLANPAPGNALIRKDNPQMSDELLAFGHRKLREHGIVDSGDAKRDELPEFCRRCDVRFACHGECPKNRFLLTPDGETGLNYLCAGYKRFFGHIDSAMRFMANELAGERAPAHVMEWVRAQDRQREAAVAGRNDPCPCGSGRKFKKCCGAD